MKWGRVGSSYEDGEVIFAQGSHGDSMGVVQEGTVDVIVEKRGKKIQVDRRSEGDLLGEMTIFGSHLYASSYVARGAVRVLTLDRKGLMRRLHEDPLLGLRIAELMAQRVHDLSEEVVRLKTPESE